MGSCANGSTCSFAHVKESKKVCEFYIKGHCRFGNYCQLSHVKPKQQQPQSRNPIKVVQKLVPISIVETPKSKFESIKLCSNHINNYCSKSAGDCQFIHGLLCNTCGKNLIDPSNPNDHDCGQKPQESSLECTVCFEVVLARLGGKFGLLECDHCVCYKCIR